MTDALLSSVQRACSTALLLMVQGSGLPDKMICVFRNSTFAAAVNATVLSDTEGTCLSPEWPGDHTVEVCAAWLCLSHLAALWAFCHLACLGCTLGMPADWMSYPHMLLVPVDTWPGVCTNASRRWPRLCCCSASVWHQPGCPARSTLAFSYHAGDEPLAICTVVTAYCSPVDAGSPLLQVSLTVLAGKCRFAFAFGYYQDPLVQGLNPLRGPRYGSFPLQVHLQDQVVLLQDAVSHFLATKCTHRQMCMAPAGLGGSSAVVVPIAWALLSCKLRNRASSILISSLLQRTTLQQIHWAIPAAPACNLTYVTQAYARLASGALSVCNLL